MKTDKPILLLEDDEVDVLTIRKALRELEVSNDLLVAADGEEGLEMLRDPRLPQPGIVLLDLNMPRMDGFEFLSRVRRDGLARGVPVVVLTTSRQDQDVVKGFELNIAGYMIKPVNYGEFVQILRTIDQYWTMSELPS